jgi:2-keto-4-pentenoate hydratase/2-oxohepta-3-ene-1,7-dioic acid hydratase in catechol pathway
VRYVSFRQHQRCSYGVLAGDEVIDLGTPDLPTLRSRLDQGPLSLQAQVNWRGLPRHALATLQLLPPIPDPDKIVCVGLNYVEHAREANLPVPTRPSLFVRFPGSLVGHLEATVCPWVSSQYDFEAELAVVIGTRGRHVPELNALAHVAGYSCFADQSIRDWQRHAPQITAGKNFDRSGAFGPYLTTPDEINLEQTEVIGRLNETEVQRDRISGMIFNIPALISYISEFAELLPGDVIATGTPAGVGFARKPPLFMKPGDRFEVEITGVGILANPIQAEEHV